MNNEARRLGAFDTKAITPHGLDSPGQLSSAYDLALIGREALGDATIAELAATPVYDFPTPAARRSRSRTRTACSAPTRAPSD